MAHIGETSGGHQSAGMGAMIEIKMKTMDSQTHRLCISNQWNVQRLKQHIALMNGMPIEQQRLIYRGRVLQDNQFLSSYNIENGDTLHLVGTRPGMPSVGSLPSRRGASHDQGVQVASVARSASAINGHNDDIPPNTQQESPDILLFLSRYLDRMRREYNINGTENNNEANIHEAQRSASYSFTSQGGNPRAEQLARLLSTTRAMLINQTSQRLLELEGDLRHNLNVRDPRLRDRAHTNLQRSGTIFQNLGAYFLELGRMTMQAQMGHNGSTAMVNAGPPFYINDFGPNPLSILLQRSLLQPRGNSRFVSTTNGHNSGSVNNHGSGLRWSRFGLEIIGGGNTRSLQTLRNVISIVPGRLPHSERSGVVEDSNVSSRAQPSHHQHELASSRIRLQNNAEVTNEDGGQAPNLATGRIRVNVLRIGVGHSQTQVPPRGALPPEVTQLLRSVIPGSEFHVERAATPGAATNNVAVRGDGPSTIVPRSAHESSDEAANEDVGTSTQQTDVEQTPAHAKRQRTE